MLFLTRFREISHLGKGSFGQVYLVEDQNKQRYALKVIRKQLADDDFNFRQRQQVEGEIQCLKMMNSPNIIKLHQNFQTKDRFYLLLQYCEHGDLQSYMKKNKISVLPMDKATKIMADIIRGLESMHNAGYLHRDIKPQNVLIKTQNDQQVAKLGDLGLSKTVENNKGSYVGTKWFQSPEILGGEKYGFQVDMWAFGVFFYYILNGEGLFKQSFSNKKTRMEKKQYLQLEAYSFSYKKTVQKSKFKFMWNCSDEIQDLFKKIFQLDITKRITFSELRQHPVFKKHFLTKSRISQKIYEKNRFSSKINMAKAQIIEGQFIDKQMESIEIHMKIHTQYPNESQFLLRKKNQIYFLNHCAQLFYTEKDILSIPQRLMICYCLKKYYLIFLKKYKNGLKKKNLIQQYQKQKYVWDKITKTIQFKQFKKNVKSQLNQTRLQLLSLYDQCQRVKDSIKEINRSFQTSFSQFVEQFQQPQDCKKYFRLSCSVVYKTLKTRLDNKQYKNQQEKQKIWFLTTLIVFAHVFNRIIETRDFLVVIFPQYLQQTKISPEKSLFMDLFYWLQKKDSELLNQKINVIWHNYLKKQ